MREFVEKSLGTEGLKKAVLVIAPADGSPLMRIMATELCHSIAAHYRDQGKHVLLLVDSLTRYAMALREVALALAQGQHAVNRPHAHVQRFDHRLFLQGIDLRRRHFQDVFAAEAAQVVDRLAQAIDHAAQPLSLIHI